MSNTPEKNYGIPYVDPVPQPEPDHKRKILRERWFEIVTVILLIIAGTSYLSFRNYQNEHRPEAARSLASAQQAIEARGCSADGTSDLAGRHFVSYAEKIDGFTGHIDLVGTTPDAPLETMIAWLTPLPGQAAPSPEALQGAVNHIAVLGQSLVNASNEAFEKAARTMKFENNTARPHDKGVAGSSDGWKLTYVTYRSFDDAATPPPPMLYLVLQRLDAASNDSLAAFNRALYQAIDEGADVKNALKSIQGGTS